MNLDEPFVDPVELAKANARHDEETGFQRGPKRQWKAPMKDNPGSGWKEGLMGIGSLLTDRKIERYEKKGFYSLEYRQARKEFAQKKKNPREGNFDLTDDGRMIYRP